MTSSEYKSFLENVVRQLDQAYREDDSWLRDLISYDCSFDKWWLYRPDVCAAIRSDNDRLNKYMILYRFCIGNHPRWCKADAIWMNDYMFRKRIPFRFIVQDFFIETEWLPAIYPPSTWDRFRAWFLRITGYMS